ncbi:GGDEF domain-containing protein [Pseudoalteromonas espejiana]|nr:GGDEF domain-containing protein [Pseudoalteromonas espejiana]
MSIFFVVQCSLLARKAFVYVSIGLMLWIVGATADVLDEVVIQPLWVSMYIEDLCRSSGMVITAYGLFKTMTFMQKMHKRLAQEFIIDDLTKVYNRRCFYEYVDRSHDKQYTLIVIDIDHFKSINDEFGHDMGDRVLKVFAKKVNALFENENMFARIGGEEFAGYFPSSQFENVVDVSEQILEKVRTINVKDDRFLTVSIGIAKRLNKHEHFDTVMKRADQALYLAKDSGRNQLRLAP